MSSLLPEMKNDPHVIRDCFDTASFLIYISELDGHITLEEDFVRLDRLCKKNDVVKSIKKYYSSDLAESLTDESLSEKQLLLFLDVLIRSASFRHDLKFLNSAFKLIDSISLDYSGLGKELSELKARAVGVLGEL